MAVSNPYDEGDTVVWTKTQYDALGRVKIITAPNGTVTTNNYVGRVTEVSVNDDGNIQKNVTLVDAKGQTVKVWNANTSPGTLHVKGENMNAADIEYKFDGFGRMRETILKGQAQKIFATYDALGNQTSLDDPDKGPWTYINNALGQVVQQTDAKNHVTVSVFDRLGRQVSRTVRLGAGPPIETTNWHYYGTVSEASSFSHVVHDNMRGWVGQPQRQELDYNDPSGVAGDYTTRTSQYFDTKGRLNTNLYEIDNQYYYTYLTYDAFNRIEHKDYFWRPAGLELNQSLNPEEWQKFGLKYSYDSDYSYVKSVDDSMGRNWWLADDNHGYDHLDRPVLFQKGSGHWTRRTYDDIDQLLTGIETGLKSGNTNSTRVQNLSYTWDGLGNLTTRSTGSIAGSPAPTETFAYDNLNRLKTRNGTQIASYLPNGNIEWKRDVSGTQSPNYTYNAQVTVNGQERTLPHAVSDAWDYNIEYDANGNMSSRFKSGETWAFRWTPFDKPRFISKNGIGSEFRYDANRQRAVHLKFDSMTGGANSEPEHYTTKKLYFGNRMEADFINLAPGAVQDWEIKNVRVYIDGPDGRTGSFEFHPNEPPADRAKPLVYHQDHLGSIDSVTEYGVTTATFALDDDGKPSRYSYDPWGERRDPLDWDGAPGASTSPGGVTPRGFTDHEMLDELGLVHMNGRIFDGQIGRFLSADIIVQFPNRLQSFNRYSYVRNNPLTYTDPSGYAEDELTDEDYQRLREQRNAELNNYVSGRGADSLFKSGSGTGNSASGAATDGANAAQPAETPVTDRTKFTDIRPLEGDAPSRLTPSEELGQIEESGSDIVDQSIVDFGEGIESGLLEVIGQTVEGMLPGDSIRFQYRYVIPTKGKLKDYVEGNGTFTVQIDKSVSGVSASVSGKAGLRVISPPIAALGGAKAVITVNAGVNFVFQAVNRGESLDVTYAGELSGTLAGGARYETPTDMVRVMGREFGMKAFVEGGYYGTVSYELSPNLGERSLNHGFYARAVFEYQFPGRNRVRVERRKGGGEVGID